MVYPSDLSDGQWSMLAIFFPEYQDCHDCFNAGKIVAFMIYLSKQGLKTPSPYWRVRGKTILIHRMYRIEPPWMLSVLELQCCQACVKRAGSQEFFMFADSFYVPPVDDGDAAGTQHGSKAVGNDEGGAPFH